MLFGAMHCFLVALLVLVLEIVETRDSHKLIRPYKYYQPRPWRRPRFYAHQKSPKLYHSKRIPLEDYHSRRPNYYSYGSEREGLDEAIHNRPYTIVIQLPKGEGKFEDNNYAKRKRTYERASLPEHSIKKDYIDDEDDIEPKVVKVNDKKVQIKMVKGENPKLHIQISRSDNDENIEIMDKSNATALNLPLLFKAPESMAIPVQQSTDTK
ncbi:uncharacterized protein LOC143425684 [Xylocopa sonorina]|uniref:uncharacterized protein LOC143425684 n=1 Tax=Xylocopa sonorina TaxID=1818115 RepID=UPI00403AB558